MPQSATISRDAAPMKVVVVLSAMMAFASISTDIYLPALPTLKQAFAESSANVEWTLSGFLVGFSIGQLLWGPISDRYGRRLPMLAGIVLFIIGSIGCAEATTLWHLIGWRVIQAAGACAGPVIARAMARDLYGRDRAAQLLSTLMLVMGIAPLLGPLVGAQVLHVGSWRTLFWMLAVIGVVMIAAVWRLPESLPADRRSTTPIQAALAGYGVLLRNRTIMAYALASGFYYAGLYAYLAGTPFAYITYYKVPAEAYGLLLGLGIIGQMALNLINRRYVVQLGSERMFRWGATLVAVSGLWSGAAAWTGIGGLPGLVVPLFVFLSANGLFIANAVAGAMEAQPDRAGATSALVGSIQFGSGIFGSALVGWFADGTPRSMGAVIAVTGVCSVVAAQFVSRKTRSTAAIIQQC